MHVNSVHEKYEKKRKITRFRTNIFFYSHKSCSEK